MCLLFLRTVPVGKGNLKLLHPSLWKRFCELNPTFILFFRWLRLCYALPSSLSYTSDPAAFSRTLHEKLRRSSNASFPVSFDLGGTS